MVGTPNQVRLNEGSNSLEEQVTGNRFNRPDVLDARPRKNNQSQTPGTPEGDVILTIQEFHSPDVDDQSTTLENSLGVTTNATTPGIRNGQVAKFNQSDRTQQNRTSFGRGAGGRSGRSTITSSVATIGLPTPDNLQEAMRIGYESKNMGMSAFLQNAVNNALAAGIKAMTLSEEEAQATFNNIGSQLSQLTERVGNMYSNPAALDNVLGALANQAGVGTGFNTAFNNTFVQQFSGVAPRTFTFTWKLYANDQAESSNIFKIIDLLKTRSHPELVDPLLNIIKYPSVLKRFDIRSPNGLIIFPIFESVITDIVVDYSASGSPFFFKSGAPASISLTMSITEITSRTSEDYQKNPSGFA